MDWNAIKAEYIAGGTSYRKLAEKYKVSRTTLERKAKDEKWSELRRQAEGKAEAKIINAISKKKASIDDKYFRLVDKLFDKAEATIDAIEQWHPTLLKEMATTMKYLKECKGIKSEADMREQEARIAKLRADAEKDDANTNKEIKITFDGDVDEYST